MVGGNSIDRLASWQAGKLLGESTLNGQLALTFEQKSAAQIAFDEYDQANPNVYELFKRFAFKAIQKGHKRFSARAIFHRCRWEMNMETEDQTGFKINNNYSRYYALKFMADFPEHQNFFETRGGK